MARVGTTRHFRRNMPKVAKNVPASTNSRSPATPCTPMVVIASPPITTRPATMTSAPVMRFAGSRSCSTTVASTRPSTAAVEGWMMPPWPSGTSGKPE